MNRGVAKRSLVGRRLSFWGCHRLGFARAWAVARFTHPFDHSPCGGRVKLFESFIPAAKGPARRELVLDAPLFFFSVSLHSLLHLDPRSTAGPRSRLSSHSHCLQFCNHTPARSAYIPSGGCFVILRARSSFSPLTFKTRPAPPSLAIVTAEDFIELRPCACSTLPDSLHSGAVHAHRHSNVHQSPEVAQVAVASFLPSGLSPAARQPQRHASQRRHH